MSKLFLRGSLGSDPANRVVTENKVAIWQNGAATGASRDVVFKRVESASPLQQYLVWSVGSGRYQFQWTVAPAPTGLTATPGHAQVGLKWNPSVAATGYNVKRFITPGGPYTAIATGLTDTRYTDLTAANDQTCHYVVSAVSASGESMDSYAASATPAFVLDAGFETPRVRSYQANPSGDAWTYSARSGLSANGTDMTSDCPSAPQANQVAFLQSGGTIAQSLSDLSPGAKYQMTFAATQRVSPSGAHAWSVQLDGKDLWVFGPVVTTFTDCYTNYAVVFAATAASHTLTLVGPATGDDTVFLDDVRVAPLCGQAPLAAPAKLTAAAVSSTAIKLEWSASPGASGYVVKRAATAGGPYTTVAANVSPTTYTNSGLTQGTGYYYVVAAANSEGAGPDSAPASGTPTTEADNIVGDWLFLDSHNPGWHVERGWGRAATATPTGFRIGSDGARPPEGMISVAAPAGLAFVNSGVEMIFTAHDLGPANRSYLSIRDRHGKGVGLGTVSGKLFLRAWGSENPPASREVDATALVDGKPHALALVCLDDGTLKAYLDGALMDSRKIALPSSPPATIGVGMELDGGWYMPYGTVIERVRAFRFASGAFKPQQLLRVPPPAPASARP